MPCNVSVRGAFQLTPSVGRATGNHLICVMLTHISTHALHGEGDHGIVAACITDDISIHALREESDRPVIEVVLDLIRFQSTPSARRATIFGRFLDGDHNISIHALREEGDYRVICWAGAAALFQSTPSARRATTSTHKAKGGTT